MMLTSMGVESELRELAAAMETCRRTKHQGLIVFVTGPLKFGKTSLVNRFIRETRVQDPACAVARAQCPFGRGWEATEKALYEKPGRRGLCSRGSEGRDSSGGILGLNPCTFRVLPAKVGTAVVSIHR